MKILIISEVVPEQTNVAVVEMNLEQYTALSIANGITVNVVDCSDEQVNAVMAIHAGFHGEKKYCESPLKEDWCGKFVDVKGEFSDINGVDKIIHTSFLL